MTFRKQSFVLTCQNWGEQWILDTLVQGKRNIYKSNCGYDLQGKLQAVTKGQRFVGKYSNLGQVIVLARTDLEVMGNGLKDLLLKNYVEFVTAYRASSPNIVDGWRQCKAALEL